MTAPIRVVVPTSLGGLRLDRVLAELVADVSRSELARWIANGNVEVGGAVIQRPAERVHAGAAVVVRPAPPPPSDATPDPSVVFGVLYEDDAIIVVDKPAGLVVHPARGHRSGTLVNGLLARGGPLAPPDPRPRLDRAESIAHARPGIVHRIDRGTSGVLVVARSSKAREVLKRAFAAHDIERVYDAIAVGRLDGRRTLDTAYGRHPTNRVAFTGRLARGDKRAVTHVEAVEHLAGGAVTRIECRLDTGRTHQIRVHLAEAGAPLLGDPVYCKSLGHAPRGSHDAEIRAVAAALGRQALHARVLGFAHPISGAPMRFESPWPEDFRVAVEALRAIR